MIKACKEFDRGTETIVHDLPLRASVRRRCNGQQRDGCRRAVAWLWRADLTRSPGITAAASAAADAAVASHTPQSLIHSSLPGWRTGVQDSSAQSLRWPGRQWLGQPIILAPGRSVGRSVVKNNPHSHDNNDVVNRLVAATRLMETAVTLCQPNESYFLRYRLESGARWAAGIRRVWTLRTACLLVTANVSRHIMLVSSSVVVVFVVVQLRAALALDLGK